jgi:hypothetical protein
MRAFLVQRQLCVVPMAFALALTTGCGKKFVTGGGVSTVLNPAGDQVAEVFLQVDPGQIIFPTVTLPIFDPRNPSVNYGHLALKPLGTGRGEVRIGVNLSTIAHLPAGAAVLPNGLAIPVLGTAQARVLSIPVPNTRFVIYVAIDINGGELGKSPVAMIGAALPFVEFDAIGTAVGDANLFLSFDLPQRIIGTAGMFGGRRSGTSGIGVFVDVSGLIEELAPVPPALMASSGVRAPSNRKLKLQYVNVNPGSSKQSKIESGLDRMSRNRVRLTLR